MPSNRLASTARQAKIVSHHLWDLWRRRRGRILRKRNVVAAKMTRVMEVVLQRARRGILRTLQARSNS
eukprot:1908806-Prorocentrum_lima.AAC.1